MAMHGTGMTRYKTGMGEQYGTGICSFGQVWERYWTGMTRYEQYWTGMGQE